MTSALPFVVVVRFEVFYQYALEGARGVTEVCNERHVRQFWNSNLDIFRIQNQIHEEIPPNSDR